MSIKDELLNLCGKNEFKKALKKIRQLVEDDEELKDEWAFASGRLENIETRFRKGLTSQKIYDQDRNSFATYLLSLINRISEKHDSSQASSLTFLQKVDKEDLFQVYSNFKAPDEIWQGFIKDYKSYNDSWLMEYICPEDYIHVHQDRYRDPNCGNFYFLFFPESQDGIKNWKPFIRFVKFQAIVHFDIEPFQIGSPEFKDILKKELEKPLPPTLKFISVYLNFEETPMQTFFRGYKYDGNGKTEKVSIWYLMFDNNKQLPNLILKTSNNQFWQDLNRKWNISRRKSTPLRGKKIFQKVLELPEELFEHDVLID